MSKKLLKTALVLSSLLLTLSTASAATGASVTASNANQTADTGGSDTYTTQAGAVTNLDISSDENTQKWAGFYGTVSGQKVLGDGSNNFYSWTASDFSGARVISIPSGDTAPTNISSVDNPDTFLGSEYNSGSDSASNTFSGSNTVSISGDSESTVSVDTYDSGGSGTFTTYLAENSDASGQPVYIAESMAQTSGFSGTDVNYQMLVGVGETASEESFDFYLELS